MKEPYYRYHVFCCLNQRDNGEPCCNDHGSRESWAWMKERLKELGLHRPGGVRVNKAGCMGRCESGPVMVIYPEGIWYTWVDREDLEEIIQRHLVGGKPVERLRI